MIDWFLGGIATGTAVGVAVTVVMLAAGRRRMSGFRTGWTVADRLALGSCLAGAGAGIMVATLGDSAMFAPWWRGFTAAFTGGRPVPAEVRAHALAWFVPIGALIVAHYALVAVAVWRGGDRRWVGRVGVYSILAWFAIDSGSGLVTGGGFNVLLINLPAAAVGLPPFAWLARRGR